MPSCKYAFSHCSKIGYHVFNKFLVRFYEQVHQIHFGIGKKVLRYIQGTLEFGIIFESKDETKLIGFCDSNWGRCFDDIKTTFRYVFSLCSNAFAL